MVSQLPPVDEKRFTTSGGNFTIESTNNLCKIQKMFGTDRRLRVYITPFEVWATQSQAVHLVLFVFSEHNILKITEVINHCFSLLILVLLC